MIRKSDRRALSKTIAAGSIMVSTVATLSMSTDELPDALTDQEKAMLQILRAKLHKDQALMLKFAHKLRKPSASQ